ncbi:hypothetical protein LO772_16525 [Yinghuangia sp. ASG 101]|uniref:hypothetical protein n=1 Tax=Yinghuangia sp. ASG 101 TaxID=2896848 RepID=UPI001E34B508|nr:hypothetical protein [Yinghuangia sp. ASG 101]UGQ15023.1 hypothetical protein LO772_16525 [Yinghuangia sp. ASG 101]
MMTQATPAKPGTAVVPRDFFTRNLTNGDRSTIGRAIADLTPFPATVPWTATAAFGEELDPGCYALMYVMPERSFAHVILPTGTPEQVAETMVLLIARIVRNTGIEDAGRAVAAAVVSVLGDQGPAVAALIGALTAMETAA